MDSSSEPTHIRLWLSAKLLRETMPVKLLEMSKLMSHLVE